jgi:hypothetical protein
MNMSNRVLHGRLLGRHRTTDELVRLIEVNREPPRRPDPRWPDRPPQLACRWISDGQGRLVCLWERSDASSTFRPGR